MIYGYRYKAMIITGIFHLVLGIITAIISLGIIVYVYIQPRIIYHHFYLTVVTISSLWVILTGSIGIFAGRSSYPEHKTRRLKTAYMVIAILSACLFSTFSVISFWVLFSTWHYEHSEVVKYVSIGGGFLMIFEFILAIVSSSICCCCPKISTKGMVIMQPDQQFEFTNPTSSDLPSPVITITSQGAYKYVVYTPGSDPYSDLNI